MDVAAANVVEGLEHKITLDGQDIYIWEKPAPDGPRNGTLLLVHGSSMCSQPSFDLQVEGMPEASVMNWFASRGFNTWTFDCRGYGRSFKGPEMLATISEGADDAAVVSEYILDKSGGGPLLVYGISSGALRAAVLAERFPDRVARLALDAMVWTGEGSPTLEARAKKLDQWKGSTRRPLDRDFLMSIFTRDHPGSADDRIIEPFIEQALAHDNSIPNGTYIDMCTNLPVCDPEKITVPTIIMRGEYDGIASIDDLLGFFKRLPNPDKAFSVMPGVAHASFTQKNLLLAYQILYGFLTRPKPLFTGS